jgi:hypothetical protein
VQRWHQARAFERQTHEKGKHGGAIGRTALAVLHALLFDFFNKRTGQCDPSYEAIAEKAAVSYASAGRAVKRLKELRLLFWTRRCAERWEDGRFVLEQETNAYALLPSSHWRGWHPPPPPPPPWPGAWGDHPPLPGPVAAAVAALRQGEGSGAVLAALESDPRDGLAAALARLGRAIGGGQT